MPAPLSVPIEFDLPEGRLSAKPDGPESSVRPGTGAEA